MHIVFSFVCLFSDSLLWDVFIKVMGNKWRHLRYFYPDCRITMFSNDRVGNYLEIIIKWDCLDSFTKVYFYESVANI